MNRLPVGSIRIRKNSNNHRAYIKVSEPSNWRERAKIVWEKANGSIPAGFVIHHVDGDPLNDSIENLALATRKDHMNIHRPTLNKLKQRSGGGAR
jgi:hypothetical protein